MCLRPLTRKNLFFPRKNRNLSNCSSNHKTVLMNPSYPLIRVSNPIKLKLTLIWTSGIFIRSSFHFRTMKISSISRRTYFSYKPSFLLIGQTRNDKRNTKIFLTNRKKTLFRRSSWNNWYPLYFDSSS